MRAWRQAVERAWWSSKPSWTLIFAPLTLLFIVCAGLRRRWLAWKKIPPLPVPVVVIGNITVGGAGKTPLTLWLVQQLAARGRHPAIISRGYGRTESSALEVLRVTEKSQADEVGDEALLLFRRAACPVFVGSRRYRVGCEALAQCPDIDVLVCDDGLQHYALPRQVEIVVFDGRGIGNGWRLPVGPLREGWSRISHVDALVINGGMASLPRLPSPASVAADADRLGHDVSSPPCLPMHLSALKFYCLHRPARTATAEELQAGGKPLYALAGIGNPARFFATLRHLGVTHLQGERAFADHHRYCAQDLAFAADGVLLMSEKDAVKCAALSVDAEIWVLPVTAALPPVLADLVLEKLNGRQTS